MVFSRSEAVGPDPARPGLLRAQTGDDAFSIHTCRIEDLREADLEPSLLDHGFERADLSADRELQATFERVRRLGRVEDGDARLIRRRLRLRRLALASGTRLRILHVAPEGFILRRAGPAGLELPGATGGRGMNGHTAAEAVHADQDVEGTPLRQIMRGRAPRLLRHDSPTSTNDRSRLTIVNLWVPLEQVTRPLALMDTRTLDRARHQVAFALQTEGFLDRADDRRVNDIWSFLHDEGQRWYFDSRVDARSAWVFATLGTPHGAFALPGEATARARCEQLLDVLAALDRGDASGAARAAGACHRGGTDDAVATASLRRAIAELDAVLEGVAAGTRGTGAPGTPWRARAEAALDRVVRKSLEMRALVWVDRGRP